MKKENAIWVQYDQIGQNYIDGQKSFFSKREDWGRKLIAKFIGSLNGKALLDIGCGSGNDVALYLKKKASSVTGIDPSKYMVEIAKNKIGNKAKIFLGNYEKIPMKNKSVDIIVGRYSMHYNKKFDLAYKEMSRVLKPNGSIILMLPHPTGDSYMEISKDNIINVPLFNNQVTVRYPTHSFKDYFSETFFKYFSLEKYDEFIQEEVRQGFIVPTAMIIKARKNA